MGELLISANQIGALAKYEKVRDEIQNGDIILYKGTSFLSNCIRYFDDAYYTHAGIVWKHESSGRIFTLDMWAKGIALTPLSRRMENYSDFCVLRPKTTSKIKQRGVDSILQEWDGRDIKYDTALLLRIAIIKKTGWDITGLGKGNNFICSELVQQYTDDLDIKGYKDIKLITPQDFLRYLKVADIMVLFDDSNG